MHCSHVHATLLYLRHVASLFLSFCSACLCFPIPLIISLSLHTSLIRNCMLHPIHWTKTFLQVMSLTMRSTTAKLKRAKGDPAVQPKASAREQRAQARTTRSQPSIPAPVTSSSDKSPSVHPNSPTYAAVLQRGAKKRGIAAIDAPVAANGQDATTAESEAGRSSKRGRKQEQAVAATPVTTTTTIKGKEVIQPDESDNEDEKMEVVLDGQEGTPQESESSESEDNGIEKSIKKSKRQQVYEPVQDVKEVLAQVREKGKDFSKMAEQFKFKHARYEYATWAVRFRTELEQHGLDGVLEDDWSATLLASSVRSWSEFSGDQELRIACEKQKTVYHMLVKCVPTEAISVVITALKEHTAFHAWRALREYYIGDERRHLQRLEEQFVTFRWQEAELFPSFETRFETLVSELELAKSGKADHVKQMALMRAIEQSNHKDARGGHVFDRLNTIHNVKQQMGGSYREWMLAIRTEAQRIQEEIDKLPKRQRAENDASGSEVREVSMAESSLSRGNGGAFAMPSSMPRFNSGWGGAPRTTKRILCRQMSRDGVCSYGTRCKFSHEMPLGASQMRRGSQNQGNRNIPSGSRKDDRCFDFMAGRCRRGAACRFKHAGAQDGNAASAGERGGAAYVAEIYQVGDSSSAQEHRIIFDTGASTHLTPRLDFVRDLQSLKDPMLLKGAFGQTVKATQKGKGFVKVGQHVVEVGEIIYCKELHATLLSVGALLDVGHKVKLSAEGGIFMDRTETFAFPLEFNGGILTADRRIQSEERSESMAEANVTTRSQRQQQQDGDIRSSEPSQDPTCPSEPPIQAPNDGTASEQAVGSIGGSTAAIGNRSVQAHARYGHIGGRKLDELIKNGAADGLLLEHTHASHRELVGKCDACMAAKMARTKFSEEMKHEVERPNDKVVADVWGPFRVWQKDGTRAKYFLSLITDVFSRHVHGRIMKRKKEASDHVISYLHQSKIITGNDLTHLHTDGGKEYNKAEKALERRGVKVTRTPVYTPQHNGIAERKNRTILDMARTLLCHANLHSEHYWQDAVETAIFIHNRVTVVVPHNKTQHELWTGHKPDLSQFRVFGCDAFVRIAEQRTNSKLEPRGEKGIFIGYDSKRELCWKVRLEDGRIVSSRDVRFNEKEFSVGRDPQKLQGQLEKEELAVKEGSVNDSSDGSDSDEETELRNDNSSSSNSKRKRKDCNDDSDSENDSNSDSSSSGSDDEDSVDRRTLRKIAALERKEHLATLQQQQEARSARRSKRQRQQAKNGGLNMDDFGHLAFHLDRIPSQQLRQHAQCNSPVACFPYLSLLYHCTLSPSAVYHPVRLFSTFYPLFVFSKACLCARLHVHPTLFPLSQPPCVRPLFPSSPFLGSCHSFISTDCVYTYSR